MENRKSKEEVFELVKQVLIFGNNVNSGNNSLRCYESVPIHIYFEETKASRESQMLDLTLKVFLSIGSLPEGSIVFFAKKLCFMDKWEIKRFHYGKWVSELEKDLERSIAQNFTDVDDLKFFPEALIRN